MRDDGSDDPDNQLEKCSAVLPAGSPAFAGYPGNRSGAGDRLPVAESNGWEGGLANRAQRGWGRCWKSGVKPSDALRGHGSQHPEFDEQQRQAEHRHAAGAAAEECQR